MFPNLILWDGTELAPELFKTAEGPILIQYNVLKREALALDFTRTDRFIKSLERIGPPACMTVLFCFNGYDNVPKPLATFPEVVKYTKTVIHKYPYLWYYLLPPLNQHIFECVADATIVYSPFIKSGEMRVQFDLPKALEKFKQITHEVSRHAVSIGDNAAGKDILEIWRSALNL